MKDKFGRIEEEDGKTNDVLILFSPKDSAIAAGVLAPVLETRYSYKCETRELPFDMSHCKYYFMVAGIFNPGRCSS